MSGQTTALPGGLWPVMLTPFDDQGRIDWPALDELVDWYLDHGAAGLFACCQSSEMDDLDDDERDALVARVCARVADRVPVVAAIGFGAGLDSWTREIAQRCDVGAAAAVVLINRLCPASASDADCCAAIEALAAASGERPLGIYECPRPYHRLLPAEIVGRLAASGRFRYYKDTSCQRKALADKLRACAGSELLIANACSEIAADGIADGCPALSPIGGNAFPELYLDVLSGRSAAQPLISLCNAALKEGYPRSSKRLLQRRGLRMQSYCRVAAPPLYERDERRLDALIQVLEESCQPPRCLQPSP